MSNYENFDEQKKFACRVIADHARSTAFAIADGILPGNEGRNYVLRKIMRRAIYHGREHLGFDKLFFHKVCSFVVEQMKDAYPELAVQKNFIDKMVRLEEERFGNTLTVGLKKLREVLRLNPLSIAFDSARDILGEGKELKENLPQKITQKNEEIESDDFLKKTKSKNLLERVAQVYDTYGVPRDLIFLVLREENLYTQDDYVFNKEFDRALRNIQSQSDIGKTKQAEKINPIYKNLEETSVRSNFHGYDQTEFKNAKIIALVKDDKQVNELTSGEEGLIVLNDTPFYAESGGQVGDSGTLFNDTAHINVRDTFAPIAGIVLHKSKVESGKLKIGDIVTAKIDVEKRDATRRNHTATHLVHAALREVLGTHVKQGGSVVAPTYLRFDFTHYQPLSEVEIKEVEDLVNREILLNHPVSTDLMSIEDAMRTGAMALFGEKYGEKVRVLSIGGGEFSRELCGGTHVRATGDIGSFKITADEAIASGVRRVRAITGFDSFERFREAELLIANSLNVLKTQRDNLPNAIEKLQEELKKTRKEIDDLKMKIATGAIGGASANGDEPKNINGVNVVAKTVDGLDKSGMRHLSDTLMAKIKSGVVILARTEEDKVSFIVRVSDDLTKQISAGNIVREIAPIVGGSGGGKPDMAEGGGTDASKLNEAIEASYGVIEKMLG